MGWEKHINFCVLKHLYTHITESNRKPTGRFNIKHETSKTVLSVELSTLPCELQSQVLHPQSALFKGVRG